MILGVGGLGSGVLMNLLRLGVGRLFLVDYDVVDIHNLNRQLMFTPEDVGQPKVYAALRNSAFHNVGNTQIEVFHGNALTNWKVIVGFAKRATFVYNCIDWGDKFDTAVCSLCSALKIPLVMGGTFATSLTVDFFPPNGSPCYLCTDDANAK
jgi:molybdopterin/thiamine biosynthesis adenylyltransferase